MNEEIMAVETEAERGMDLELDLSEAEIDSILGKEEGEEIQDRSEEETIDEELDIPVSEGEKAQKERSKKRKRKRDPIREREDAAEINSPQKEDSQSFHHITGEKEKTESLKKLPEMTETFDSRSTEGSKASFIRQSPNSVSQDPENGQNELFLEAIVDPVAVFRKITGNDIRESLEKAGEHIEDTFHRMIPQDENEAGRGYTAMKNHFLYQWGQILLQNAGASSAAKSFLQQEKKLTSLTTMVSEKLMDVNGYTGTETGLTKASFCTLRKHDLVGKLKENGFSLGTVLQILRNRKEILDRIELRDELQRAAGRYPQFFNGELRFISSDRFYDTGNYQEISSVIAKYLRTTGFSDSFVHKIKGLSANQLELLSGRGGRLSRKSITKGKGKAPRIRFAKKGFPKRHFSNKEEVLASLPNQSPEQDTKLHKQKTLHTEGNVVDSVSSERQKDSERDRSPQYSPLKDVGIRSLDRLQKISISYLGKTKKRMEAQRKLYGGIHNVFQMSTAFSRYAMQGSENGRAILNTMGDVRTSIRIYRVSKGAVFYSSVFLAKPIKLAGKVGMQSVRVMGGLVNKVPAVRFLSDKASVGISNVKSTAANVKKTVTTPIRIIQYGFQNVKASVAARRIQRTERVTGGIRKTANRFVRTVTKTRVGRAVVQTGRTAGFVGKAVILPARLTARTIGFIQRGFRKILAVCSSFLAAVIFLYLIAVFLVVGVNALFELLSGSVLAGEEVFQKIQDFHENVILYQDLSDMHRDVELLEALNEEREEAAAQMGRGKPKDPSVLAGHLIDRYGSPDNGYAGYHIHYVDAYGREIPSGSSNSKDILSVATAMVDNEISYYDLTIFEELLEDLYVRMNPDYHPGEGETWQFSYKESDPYVCAYGCDTYSYFCNDHSAYTKWQEMIALGCGSYEEMEPETADGCLVDEDGYLSDHEAWLSKEPAYPSYADFEDEEAYSLALQSYYELYNAWRDGEPAWESYFYCPGHTVPACYGHKDIDIYITLYDLYYVTDNNLYPVDWESRSYAEMIRGFVENGGFTQEKSITLAENYYNNDWLYWYDLSMEGAEGFGAVALLSEEDIEEILSRYEGDSDAAREAIILYALGAVGKIPYYYGGHNARPGYEGNDFGKTIAPDAKGRTKKGLDCSGFIQWVYKSTVGAELPSTTAGYVGARFLKNMGAIALQGAVMLAIMYICRAMMTTAIAAIDTSSVSEMGADGIDSYIEIVFSVLAIQVINVLLLFRSQSIAQKLFGLA